MMFPRTDFRVSNAVGAHAGRLANSVMVATHRVVRRQGLSQPVAFAVAGSAENALNGAVGGAVNFAFAVDLLSQPARWAVGFAPPMRSLLATRGVAAVLQRRPSRDVGWVGAPLHAAAAAVGTLGDRASAAGAAGRGGWRHVAAVLHGVAAFMHVLTDAMLWPAQVALGCLVLLGGAFGAWTGALRGLYASLPAGGAAVRRSVEPVGSAITLPFGAADVGLAAAAA